MNDRIFNGIDLSCGDYDLPVKCAGGTVLEYEKFGSYQGDILMIIRINDKNILIRSYYGSCPGCDAFQREFDLFSDNDETDEHLFNRLKDFGKTFIDNSSYEGKEITDIIEDFKKDYEWDSEKKDMIKWLEDRMFYFKDYGIL